eukprot:s1247_g7.t1
MSFPRGGPGLTAEIDRYEVHRVWLFLGGDLITGCVQEAFDWDVLRGLLSQQKEDIVRSNKEHVDEVYRVLNQKMDARFASVDSTFQGVNERLQNMEGKVARLEGLLRDGAAPDSSLDEKRKHTLVFGGWQMDTQRKVIVGEVTEALERLGVKGLTDQAPFTTGPRRSVALLPFQLRSGEVEAGRRQRMQDVMSAVAEARPQTSHGKRMWAGFSKSKAQRDVSGHCSWLKRTLASFNQEVLQHLDLEFSSGSAWLGEHLVASAQRSPPVVTEEIDVVWDERLVSRPWIWVGAIAKFTGITVVDLRAALLEFKR